MKLCILGDTHFRVRPPRHRVEEDFLEVSMAKLRAALAAADRANCDALIQVGDWFDSPNPSGELVVEMIRELRKVHPPVYAIHGQHDLAYHTEASRRKSALRIMEAAGAVKIINHKGDGFGDCVLYGADFGQEIPKVRRPPKDRLLVLVAHVMVGNRELYPGQGLTGPREFVKKHPQFDLYCLGDYHYPFTAKVGSQWVINPGTLIRKTTADRELAHDPKVVIFDTEANEPEDVSLGFPPSEEVFDLTAKGVEKRETDFDFEALADLLKARGESGIDFTQNLETYYSTHETPTRVRDTIRTAMEEVSA